MGQTVDLHQIASQAQLKYGILEPLLTSGTETMSTPEAWHTRRQQIKATINHYLGEQPAQRVELSPRLLQQENLEGYTRFKFSYQTEPGEDIKAFLLVPDTATTAAPAPAMITCHQTAERGKDEAVGLSGRPSMHVGLELVKRGYVVLAPDTITAGERVYPGYQPFETEAFDQANPQWSAMGKMLWDHQRGLDFLETLAYVDKSRIGVIGHSLGAYNAFFLAAFDDRIQAVVESCGYATIQSDKGRERWARTRWFVHIPRLRPYVAPGSTRKPPFDLHDVLALVAPRPLFQNAGLRDWIFPSCDSVAQAHKELKTVYDLYKAPDKLQTYLYDGDHEFPDEARGKAYDFLDLALKPQSK